MSGVRHRLNAKRLYFAAVKAFMARNREVLPQMQLQYGRNERWLVREFALAMNQALSGTLTPKDLATFAACEWKYADITVWREGAEEADALYEVKALYSSRQRELPRVLAEARRQLAEAQCEPGRKLGLFFVIYAHRELAAKQEAAAIARFTSNVRDKIRAHFRSDHDIRLTQLATPTRITYAGDPWVTRSWITWGSPRE